MEKRLVAIIFLILSACGAEDTFPGERINDDQFNELVLEFNEDHYTHLGEEQLKTVKLYLDTEGVLAANSQAGCDSNSSEVIYVNESWWGYASDSYKKAVIYHELGHCILGLEHSDDRDSIMYRAINSGFALTARRISNLFEYSH